MLQRIIYPMIGWISRQRRFFPNWEVDKVVYVPVRNLLKADHYACYRVRMTNRLEEGNDGLWQDFPCFLHQDENEREILWGATYKIVMLFLELVFGFRPPEGALLPVVYGSLGENYFTGSE
jgi:hypothetical protein